jgi:hypothetical protein
MRVSGIKNIKKDWWIRFQIKFNANGHLKNNPPFILMKTNLKIHNRPMDEFNVNISDFK